MIAGKVQKGGKLVTSDADVARARQQGATDKEIHDTVLIAAAFCMFNRYVDGLATWAPTDCKCTARTGSGWLRKATSKRPIDCWKGSEVTEPPTRQRLTWSLVLPVSRRPSPLEKKIGRTHLNRPSAILPGILTRQKSISPGFECIPSRKRL